MEHYIKLPLSIDNFEKFVNNAKEYAMSNGIIMGSRNYDEEMVSFSPLCLLPSPFSEQWFNYAVKIQPILSQLIHKVANNYEFLKVCLKRTIESDEFTKRLFEIYETVREEGISQDISLGLLRADYMLDTDDSGAVSGLKQVEINTFASSFGGLITRLHSLHAAAILFLVEDVTYNFSDQRILEYAVLSHNSGINVIRCTFADIESQGRLENRKLFVGAIEIAVIYFRTGYVPNQYKSEKTWEARLMIEKSLAIKCPSIHYHLAGTKKVQQELAQPNVLEKFLTNSDDVKKVRAVFAAQYPLDLTEDGDKASKLAETQPEKYVMKPQREGGGNNIYGDDIINLLSKMGKTKEREGYILMELIKPPPMLNYLLRPQQDVVLANVFGELGIFGVIIGNTEKIHHNFIAGHMLRSKVQGTNEGGVAAGYGSLDLPYLI